MTARLFKAPHTGEALDLAGERLHLDEIAANLLLFGDQRQQPDLEAVLDLPDAGRLIPFVALLPALDGAPGKSGAALVHNAVQRELVGDLADAPAPPIQAARVPARVELPHGSWPGGRCLLRRQLHDGRTMPMPRPPRHAPALGWRRHPTAQP